MYSDPPFTKFAAKESAILLNVDTDTSIFQVFRMEQPRTATFVYYSALQFSLVMALDTGPKLNVYKTFTRSLGHLMNVLCNSFWLK